MSYFGLMVLVLENMIYRFFKCYGLKLPRRYRKRARKEYLAFAKSRKHTAKKIRSALRRQLGYVKRDLGYLEQFMSDGYAMTGKDIGQYLTIIRLYEPVIIQNVFWQIRYTGPGKTGAIARNMESGYQVQSWAGQALQKKLIKNRSIRIIPIESKWSAPSA